MARVKLNPILEQQLSARAGRLPIRRVTTQRLAPRTTDLATAPRVEGWSECQAIIYGLTVLAFPQVYGIYQPVPAGPAFALILADFMSAPAIGQVDLSAYGGREGDPIRVRARDDFAVGSVCIRLSDGDDDGLELESGEAVETPAGSGLWVYHARCALHAGQSVRIDVIARDQAGVREQGG